MREIRTERLLLRPFRGSDYDDLFEFLSQLEDDEFEGYPGITYENGREHLKYRLGSGEFYAVELTGSVTGFLHGDRTERYCRNGEEIGDRYACTYGCPVNQQGYGICSKTMLLLFPLMDAVRSGGDLENLGGDGRYTKTVVCPDGCVIFRLTAVPLGNENFHKGHFWDYPDQT